VRTLQQKLYRLTAGILVAWLAVFYPAMCDYHGLLLFRTAENAQRSLSPGFAPTPGAPDLAHHGHGSRRHHLDAASTPNATANMAEAASGVETEHTLPPRSEHHKPLAGESATAGLLSILTPSNFALPQLQMRTTFVLLVLDFHHQYQHPPPDQPPPAF
jgi:hypothetical protein